MAGPAVSHAAARDSLSAQFSICSSAPRVNCVVDGDTFWFRGQKIRIADIDTPELSPPRCVREAELGEAAKYRLLVLLNAGEFSLNSGLRDADRNGRKLRTVLRNGSSLGEIMISEGLARSWEGQRRSWCN
ncbi:thermonuclease family protein [Ensifer sp. ENS01]|uniref:thermonuclease family protein n=1 Tax=Ensifer sp. ENS01 TaxID=2769293 RepID=UPI001FED95A9|nr:thermonuclease family protein [Ensifer sp. ENS01]